MILCIEGYRSHNIDLYSTLKAGAEFYAVRLLGKRMANNIYLDIKLTKELKKKDKAYGFCHITDDNLNRPREFLIEVDASMKHSFEQILTWLAHEMVHLKQFVRKELCDYENLRVQWKSKTYAHEITYDDQPWEKEAYRLEDTLYEEFEEWYYEEQ